MQGSVIAPPSFVIPGHDISDEVVAAMKLLCSGEDAADSLIRDSAELYVRQMLATTALRLEVPRPFLPAPVTPKRFKSLLPISSARRVRYVDRYSLTWSAVTKYVQPIMDDVWEVPPATVGGRPPFSLVQELASHVYSIALSTSQRAAAIVPPVGMIELTDLIEDFSLRAESRARLAVLRGVANCFRRQADIPVLVCEPGLRAPLADRISEILEDAYLLEASRLRTFFSPGANWAALRRDLRNTLGWITRNRGWAKNAVRLGESAVSVPGQLDAATDLLGEIGVASPSDSCPVLLEDTHLGWTGGNTVIQVKFPTAVAVFLP